mmetsp:Transcript_2364/g.7140  ORF Transcript_2364/g.7140 Transcript_2364/m.7140 type:complete len:210 (+) Transcript_2364:160-789(+)
MVNLRILGAGRTSSRMLAPGSSHSSSRILKPGSSVSRSQILKDGGNSSTRQMVKGGSKSISRCNTLKGGSRSSRPGRGGCRRTRRSRTLRRGGCRSKILRLIRTRRALWITRWISRSHLSSCCKARKMRLLRPTPSTICSTRSRGSSMGKVMRSHSWEVLRRQGSLGLRICNSTCWMMPALLLWKLRATKVQAFLTASVCGSLRPKRSS